MLWLALHFPHLALEIFSRGMESTGPLVVAERRANRNCVIACNHAAGAGGIRPGMAVSAAQALLGTLVVRQRDAALECEALEGLAAWAGNFTPDVSLQAPAGLVLEISRCLRLHRGMGTLLEQIRQGCAELGYSVADACAATPHGAWLLAKAGQGVEKGDEATLAGLSVNLLEQSAEVKEGLELLGVKTLGACLRLPRAGLTRRFGKGLLDELDRAFGRRPEARAFFQPPAFFERRLELNAPVENAQALLFGAHRLLPELEGYLGLRLAGIQELELHCRHEDMPDTVVTLGFVEPTREADRMLLQLREILGRLELLAPVHAIVLKAMRILPLAGFTGDLFMEKNAQEDGNRLLERMRARLGADAVHGIGVAPDHRPERAWQAGTVVAGQGLDNPRRPLWLLPKPLPCRDAGLVLKSRPERIESGWWDGHDVARDYYVAQDREGARLWVYCERNSGEWFIHGLFG